MPIVFFASWALTEDFGSSRWMLRILWVIRAHMKRSKSLSAPGAFEQYTTAVTVSRRLRIWFAIWKGCLRCWTRRTSRMWKVSRRGSSIRYSMTLSTRWRYSVWRAGGRTELSESILTLWNTAKYGSSRRSHAGVDRIPYRASGRLRSPVKRDIER